MARISVRNGWGARSVRLAVAAAISAAACGGCAVGPNYQAPSERVPAQFHGLHGDQPAATSAAAFDPEQWWRGFGDETLNRLVQRALEANLDLAIATTRIEEARYAEAIAQGGLWPTFGLGTALPNYQRVSENVERAHFESRPRGSLYLRQNVDSTGTPELPSVYATTPGHHPLNFLVTPDANGNLTTNVRTPLISPNNKQRFVGRDQFVYQAGFDAAWELDVFGGVRRAIESAQAQEEAQVEARNDVAVILLADVARSYVELRGLQKRLDIAQQNIAAQEHTVAIVETRVRNGLTSELDRALAQRQLETTRARVPQLEVGIGQAQHRLATLLDMPLEDLNAALGPVGDPFAASVRVPPELPSELLRNRPDIRRTERLVAAATARIGVAVADLYPRITLSGSIGLQASDVSSFFATDSLAWSGGPGIRWPIFDAGRIIGNIEVQEARAREALLNYRRTLVVAFQEVDDALCAFSGEQQRYERLLAAVDASRRAVDIAQNRYEKGLTDFLNVLDAQRALYDLEDQATSSAAAERVQQIAVFKALGRGWRSDGPTENVVHEISVSAQGFRKDG